MWIALFIASLVSAAPYPGTATSSLVEPHSGNYLSRLGFTIHLPKNWNFYPSEMDSNRVDLKLSDPSTNGAYLTVHASPLDKKTSLEKYVRQWMKDYLHYGFEVLGSNAIEHKGKKGFLVDTYHRQKKSQSRQALFLQGQTPIIVTCLSPAAQFTKIISACNQSILSLKWVDTFTVDAPKR